MSENKNLYEKHRLFFMAIEFDCSVPNPFPSCHNFLFFYLNGGVNSLLRNSCMSLVTHYLAITRKICCKQNFHSFSSTKIFVPKKKKNNFEPFERKRKKKWLIILKVLKKSSCNFQQTNWIVHSNLPFI